MYGLRLLSRQNLLKYVYIKYLSILWVSYLFQFRKRLQKYFNGCKPPLKFKRRKSTAHNCIGYFYLLIRLDSKGKQVLLHNHSHCPHFLVLHPGCEATCVSFLLYENFPFLPIRTTSHLRFLSWPLALPLHQVGCILHPSNPGACYLLPGPFPEATLLVLPPSIYPYTALLLSHLSMCLIGRMF